MSSKKHKLLTTLFLSLWSSVFYCLPMDNNKNSNELKPLALLLSYCDWWDSFFVSRFDFQDTRIKQLQQYFTRKKDKWRSDLKDTGKVILPQPTTMENINVCLHIADQMVSQWIKEPCIMMLNDETKGHIT